MSWSQQQHQDNSPIQNIVIVGADIHGWCAAVGLARGLQGQNVNINVLDIAPNNTNIDPVIHASEHLFDFHRLLGIQDKQLLVNGHAKLCSGKQFINFSEQHPSYFMGCDKTQPTFCTIELHHVLHWLGIDNIGSYSLSGIATEQSLLALPTNNNDTVSAGFSPTVNLDAANYLRFMQGAATHLGINLIQATINQVHYHSDNGFINQLELTNGDRISVDLVLDNSGSDELFSDINQQRRYIDCSDLLSFNKKVTLKAMISHQAKPYQQLTATEHGIVELNFMPTFHSGTLHYSSKITSDKQAKQQLFELLPNAHELEFSDQRAGYTETYLSNNCFVIGNGAGYLGTSPFSQLILLQRSISKLLELFPGKACLTTNSTELNRRISRDYQQALHYSLLIHLFAETPSSNNSAAFTWQLDRQQLPKELQQKINLFSNSGRVSSELNPLISRDHWLTLLKYKVRQRQGYEPVLDALDKNKAQQFLQQLSQKIQHCLNHYRQYH